MQAGKVDVFLTYCTNAVLAKGEMPELQIVDIPSELRVEAEYGMVVLKGAPSVGLELVRFIQGKDGQAILEKHGFGRGDPSTR